MKVDELLYALAIMRHRLNGIDTMYGVEGTSRRVNMISSMRGYVFEEDAVGFTRYCQDHLAMGSGDTMVDLLEELYTELGLTEQTMWDEFATAFLV